MKHIPPKPQHVDVHYEDDLIVVRVHGSLDEATALHLTAIHDELALRVGYALELHVSNEITELTPQGRRCFFQWNRQRPYHGAVAIVGASFAIRAVVMLLARAVKFIVKDPSVIGFFEAEAEARTWLEQQRVWLKKPMPQRE